MLKKLLCVVLSFFIVIWFLPVYSNASEISVSAESAVVLNADTGEILYSKNPYEKRGMASTTKIMTSLVALEYGNLTDTVKAKLSDVTVEGTSIGLKEGDEVSLETLVAGMLLESGNDAANVTATMIGGSKEKFSQLMNKKAKELGMLSTNFKNPSGLTEEGHYSTAYDMALLASETIKNQKFRELCSTRSYKATYGTPQYQRTFYNHNKFLSIYDGALGIKTGFTKASGRCLITAAERDGVTLVAVTLNARDDWNDHVKMMEYAFGILEIKTADFDAAGIKVSVVGSQKKQVSVKLSSPLSFASTKDFKDYETVVYVKPFLYAGVNEGDYVGWVELKNKDGKVITSSYLVSAETAKADFDEFQNVTVFQKFINKIKEGLS
ncbi:MAG: D-alanyl-D-alanine carboxypeptidase [Clostridia bacterium]|nr:D-alanyl-D-alanine carboxypeptidase [Clostridia bacterium]